MAGKTIVSLCALLLSSFSFAGTNELDLKYPELSVTPLASKRVEMEAGSDRRTSFGRYWTYQLSALTTLYAASQLNSYSAPDSNQDKLDRRDTAVMAGRIVGLAWLIGSVVLETQYRPYEKFLGESGPAKPGMSQSEVLTRERLAEEVLFRAESLNRKLKWASFLSELVVAGYMQGSYSGGKSNFSAPLAALVSGLPLLFPTKYESVGEIHRDYKKRIYGNIVSSAYGSYLPNPSIGYFLDSENKVNLVQNFSWSF